MISKNTAVTSKKGLMKDKKSCNHIGLRVQKHKTHISELAGTKADSSAYYICVSANKLLLNAPHRLQLKAYELICSSPAWEKKTFIPQGGSILYTSFRPGVSRPLKKPPG